MSRKRKGAPVHGWVIVDKPQGVTSTQVVGAVRRIFDAQKAGHAGTLDPMATGVLAVALGEATKTVPYAMDAEKTYRFTASWGESRDSDDAEGAVTATSDKRPTREEIEAAIPESGGHDPADPAHLFRDQGRRRARLRSRPRRRGGGAGAAPGLHPLGQARWTCPTPARPSSRWSAARGLTSGPGCAIWLWRWARLGYVSQLRRLAIGNFNVVGCGRAGNLEGFYA